MVIRVQVEWLGIFRCYTQYSLSRILQLEFLEARVRLIQCCCDESCFA